MAGVRIQAPAGAYLHNPSNAAPVIPPLVDGGYQVDK